MAVAVIITVVVVVVVVVIIVVVVVVVFVDNSDRKSSLLAVMMMTNRVSNLSFSLVSNMTKMLKHRMNLLYSRKEMMDDKGDDRFWTELEELKNTGSIERSDDEDEKESFRNIWKSGQ
ncbi:hypothetical protein LOAG_13411 [Loa loa]|uniref:Transmembrane protein n=1 Tax=Loa loa TaxID=7209 RepID=A0A1S0TK03_LOALO|nr:hypothetical protein LOAG_13411 [Loa loa]EFO15102.1 hypothetical protein LOAG_13411 [Loa loa]